MKNLVSKIKAGAKIAPALIIYIYLLLGSLDLITTYLASPDLKHEGNWVVRKFNLNWPFLITYLSVIYLTVIFMLLLSLDYLNRYYFNHKSVSFKTIITKPFKNYKLILSIIILGLFYSHFINVCHVILNNCLSLIYFKGEEGILKDISVYYINRQKYFVFYIQYVTYIPGFLIGCIKVNRIKKGALIQNHSLNFDFTGVH